MRYGLACRLLFAFIGEAANKFSGIKSHLASQAPSAEAASSLQQQGALLHISQPYVTHHRRGRCTNHLALRYRLLFQHHQSPAPPRHRHHGRPGRQARGHGRRTCSTCRATRQTLQRKRGAPVPARGVVSHMGVSAQVPLRACVCPLQPRLATVRDSVCCCTALGPSAACSTPFCTAAQRTRQCSPSTVAPPVSPHARCCSRSPTSTAASPWRSSGTN